MPPYLSSDRNYFESLSAFISDAYMQIKPNDHLILLGDFNQPALEWSPAAAVRSDSSSPMRHYVPHIFSNSSSSCFLDVLNLHELYQLNGVHNHLNHYLDLVLSNSAAAACCSVYPASSLLLPQDAHHPALEIELPSSLFRASY